LFKKEEAMSSKANLMTIIWTILAIVILLAACQQAEPTAEVAPTQAPAETTPAEAPTAAPEPTEAPPAAEEPVILRVGGVNGPDCLNMFSCSTHWYFNYLLYEGFTGSGPRCETFPRLAESWEVSEDGTTWTLHLHEGIKYTDGTPFDAHSAVEYIEWFRSTSLKEWFYESTYMTEIKALDDYTVQFTTEVPIITFPGYNSVWWWMLPPHIWTQLDDDTLYTFDELPIGTGPYDLVEYVQGDHLIYEAKEDYYLGRPAVDRIVYQIYANWDAVIQALRSGEIDVTESAIPVSYIPVLETAEEVVVETRPPGPIQAITFNLYAGGNKHPAIEDPKVREAIDYATDKQQILDLAFEGYGMLCPTNWACGPNFEGELNPDLEVTPFDPTMAMQILDEAGYLDTDGDGIRETADGQPLNFRVYVEAEEPTDLVSADLVQQMLRDVGIETEVEAVESGTLWALVLGERDFDMTIRAYNTDLDPAYIDYIFSCWSADFGEGALNESGYCNDKVDELTFEYMTQPNMEEAMPYIFEAQAIVNQDRPIIFLAASYMVEAYRTDRFDFPAPGESCDMNPGYWDWPLILEVKPK
jgi:peptide/nickel transport system substrate-binding protein